MIKKLLFVLSKKTFIKSILITLILLMNSAALFAFNEGERLFAINLAYGQLSPNSSHLPPTPGADDDWEHATFDTSRSIMAGIEMNHFLFSALAFNFAFNFEYNWNSVKFDDHNESINILYYTVPVGLRIYIKYFFVGGGFYYSYEKTHSVMKTNISGPSLKYHDLFGAFADAGLIYTTDADYSHYSLFVRYKRNINHALCAGDEALKNTKFGMFTINISFGLPLNE